MPIPNIRVISGCMFSGKTSRLLWYLKRADLANRKVVLFKPQIDNRYSASEVVTHDNTRVPSMVISQAVEILPLADQYDVIGIDEIHFFDARQLVAVAEKLAAQGKAVVAAGLDLDAEDNAFEATKELMGIAEFVEKLQAVCADCNNEYASRSYRKSQSKEKFEVGGKEAYLPLCRVCNAKRKAPK
ncbi:MAG: thymidine kinase [Candidatus Komeilibacteria bacterium]